MSKFSTPSRSQNPFQVISSSYKSNLQQQQQKPIYLQQQQWNTQIDRPYLPQFDYSRLQNLSKATENLGSESFYYQQLIKQSQNLPKTSNLNLKSGQNQQNIENLKDNNSSVSETFIVIEEEKYIGNSQNNIKIKGKTQNTFEQQDQERGNYLFNVYFFLFVQSFALILTAYIASDVFQEIQKVKFSLLVAILIFLIVTLLPYIKLDVFSHFPLDYLVFIIQTAILIIIFIKFINIYLGNEMGLYILTSLAAIYLFLFCYTATLKTEPNIMTCMLLVICAGMIVFQLFLIFTNVGIMKCVGVLIGVSCWGMQAVLAQTQVCDSYYEKTNPVVSAVTILPDVVSLLFKSTDLLRQTIVVEKN